MEVQSTYSVKVALRPHETSIGIRKHTAERTGVTVVALTPGGAAERNGRIQPSDKIIKINRIIVNFDL